MLEYQQNMPSCNKIFTDFTPTLRASSGIMAFLTILSFLLSIVACTSLCCEVRFEEMPVLPAFIAPASRGVQVVQVGAGQYGPYPPTDTAGAGTYADGGKIQQAYYIDESGAAIGMPPAAAAAAVAASAAPQNGGWGYMQSQTPTVVAYALPAEGNQGTTQFEPRVT